jgi:hypothetical protein
VLEAFIKEKGQQLPSPAHLESADCGGFHEAEEDPVEGVSTTMLHLHVSSLSGLLKLIIRWARQASKCTFMGPLVLLHTRHEIHR